MSSVMQFVFIPDALLHFYSTFLQIFVAFNVILFFFLLNLVLDILSHKIPPHLPPCPINLKK